MTYERINFVDQSVERPRTYEMTHNADGSVTLVDSFGLIDELGTPINADTMNHIEDGIAAAAIRKYNSNEVFDLGEWVLGTIEEKTNFYKSLKSNNLGNPLTDTNYWEVEEIGTGGSGHSLFDIVFKDHILTYKESENFAQLGTYVYKTAVAGSRYGYSTFYATCVEEKKAGTATQVTLGSNTITMYINANGHQYYDIVDKSAVDAFYEATGIAWFYGVDTGAERIFLPRNDYYFKNGSAEDVGKTVEQELPNIKGSFNASLMTSHLEQSTSGAVSATQKSNNSKGGTGHTFTEYQIDINASKSNSTYKDGGEVIPKSVSMIAYMVVGNTANEEALTDVIDITTTENDTLPLFYNTYSQQDMTSTGAFVNASLGNYLDGNVWTTAYAEIEAMGIGAKFDAGTIKAYGDSTITDYDLVLNESDMTFRLPLKNGGEDAPDWKNAKVADTTMVFTSSAYTILNDGYYTIRLQKNTVNASAFVLINGQSVLVANNADQWQEARGVYRLAKGDVLSCSGSVYEAKILNYTPLMGNGNLYYKLNNVVQNAQLVDLVGVTSALSKKVSADNLMELMPSFCMADFSAGVEQSFQTEYTATCDGLIMFFVSDYNTTSYLILDGVSHMIQQTSNNQLSCVFAPVPIVKGTVYKLNSGRVLEGQYLKFYPAKGAL